MLEVRRIKAEEAVDASKVSTIAFNGRHDFTQEEAPNPLKTPVEWTYGAFENGKIVSKMTDIPYVMRFDGHDAKMSGIGGVATLPEARSGGMVRSLFKSLLTGAYADGVVFSCLGPFSHAFYRKFGYELCCPRREMRVPISEFEKFKYAGSHEQIFPGDNTEGLERIHSAYISDINHGIRRDTWPDNIAWRIFTSRDPYKTGCFVYLWRNGAGEPRGYIKYQHKYAADVSEIEVRELMYLDREALYAQLGFVGKLSAAIREFVWAAPMYVDPSDLVDVAWVSKQRMITRDMTRVVNVKAALEMMRKPDGEGAYVIETDDVIVPENNGRWLVEYGPEGSRVSATQKSADLSCELPALAQLVTGYRPIGEMLFTSRLRVDVAGNMDMLKKVFTPRPQYLTEDF